MSKKIEKKWSSNKEILDQLLHLEKIGVKDLFQNNRYDFWPAVRIRLAFYLIIRRYSKTSKTSKTFFSSDFFDGVICNLKNFRKKLCKTDVLLVSHSNYKYSLNGKSYDRVLEGIKLECVENGEEFVEFNLDTSTFVYGGNAEKVKSYYIIFFLIKILAYIQTKIFKFRTVKIYHAMDRINSEFSNKFPKFQVSESQISQYLNYMNLLILFFKYIFKRLKIKKIYQATYYDPVGLSINAAAADMMIKTYCAQHGGQSRNNPAFGQWTKINYDNGYSLLPDVFLCWDRESANTITEWSSNLNNHLAIVTGYHWPDLWRTGKIPYEPLKKHMQNSKENLNVIFSMQPSIGLPPNNVRKIIDKVTENVTWWIRLHPRQIGTEIEDELKFIYWGRENVIINEASYSPLPALMTIMDLHITCFSSCLFESIVFDVPTVFVHKAGGEYFSQHIRSGDANLITDDKDIEDFICDAITKKILSSSDSSETI